MNSFVEEVKTSGEILLPRFGHTMTPVGKSKVILFGGAIGDSVKYNITRDTFSFDIDSLTWTKLICGGTLPAGRAAHGCTATGLLQMVVYGGAAGGN